MTRWRAVLGVAAVLATLVAGLAVAALVLGDEPVPRAGGFSGRRWTWEPASPRQRTEVAAGVVGGTVWVAGGMDPDGAPSPEVMVYDTATGNWSAGPPLPQPLHHTAVAGNGARFWVAGGFHGRDLASPTALVWGYDRTSGRWLPSAPLPEPRAAGALVWDGGRLVYGGGVGPRGVADDVFALEGARWRRIGALRPAREHLAAASDGAGATWFLGGRAGGIGGNLAQVDVVRGGSVSPAGELPTPRGGVAGFYVPGVGACAAGGEGPAGTFDEVECLGADGTPATLPPLAASRHGLGAAVLDGTAYVLLGGPEPGLSVSDTVQALDLTAPPG